MVCSWGFPLFCPTSVCFDAASFSSTTLLHATLTKWFVSVIETGPPFEKYLPGIQVFETEKFTMRRKINQVALHKREAKKAKGEKGGYVIFEKLDRQSLISYSFLHQANIF